MPSEHSLSAAAQLVHRHDRERFVTALFAPAAGREALLTLYAFNLEIARVRENVHEAMAGMIRLQWWRDVLTGERDHEAAHHPVAGPLLALVRERALPVALFDLMLTAREKDLLPAPFATTAELVQYAAQSAGALSELAVLILGAEDEVSRQAGRLAGEGAALAGLLRALPVHLGQGWMILPREMLEREGSSPEEAAAGRTSKEILARIAAELACQSRLTLTRARQLRPARRAIPALLGASLASAHLRRLERSGWDMFDAAHLRPHPMPLRLTINALLGRF